MHLLTPGQVTQPGTYWYHSHESGQYPDGFRGPLIIHDPENPYADLFDEELVLTLSDWYHEQMPSLISKFVSVTNPTGAEPGMFLTPPCPNHKSAQLTSPQSRKLPS